MHKIVGIYPSTRNKFNISTNNIIKTDNKIVIGIIKDKCLMNDMIIKRLINKTIKTNNYSYFSNNG